MNVSVQYVLLADGRVLAIKTDKPLPMTDARYLDADIMTQDEYRARVRVAEQKF